MTANEQHFQRDSWLSQRHRTWGLNAPAMDIDFLLIEYDNCTPKAIIDYKHENSTIDINSASARTLGTLGDMATIPAYIVVYGHDQYDKNALWSAPAPEATHWFTVNPLNDIAVNPHSNMIKIPELKYVDFLYKLRGRFMPADLAWRLGQ